MKNFLNLGIIYSQFPDGLYYMTAHRSLLKIILNPFLRMFGWQLGSIASGDYRIDPQEFEIESFKFDKLERKVFNFSESWNWKPDDTDKILKKRMFY